MITPLISSLLFLSFLPCRVWLDEMIFTLFQPFLVCIIFLHWLFSITTIAAATLVYAVSLLIISSMIFATFFDYFSLFSPDYYWFLDAADGRCRWWKYFFDFTFCRESPFFLFRFFFMLHFRFFHAMCKDTRQMPSMMTPWLHFFIFTMIFFFFFSCISTDDWWP